MISFKGKFNEVPLKKFKKLYEMAFEKKQLNIEAACISTIGKNNQPDGRFVNIKYFWSEGLTFFSNYESPKAQQIKKNKKVSITFFWPTIDCQIRIKAFGKKIPLTESDNHFSIRSHSKNALAISSMQSKEIKSYIEVKKKYDEVFNTHNIDLHQRPSYWGGFILNPFYYEFWTAHPSRINKREAYEYNKNKWKKKILEP